jgi:diaminopimelate decarboxylase
MPDGVLLEIARQFGTPCYVYFPDRALARIQEIRARFQNLVGVSYAVKANPNRALLRRLQPAVDHLDVSSGGEILVAREAGFDPAHFTFVGPAKTDWELRLALEVGCGRIVVESVAEMERLNALTAERGGTCAVILRINPTDLPQGYEVSMSMRATPFGIDEENLDEALESLKTLRSLSFHGFHIYAGAQCLKNESIVENIENCARIFREFSERHSLQPRNLIFGSGFGIPYHERDEPIDLAMIAERTLPIFQSLRNNARTSDAELSLELGRWLVGEAGCYLSSVVRVKTSRGARIAILDGGMSQHLAASGNLGGVAKRNYPIFRVTPEREGDPNQAWDLSGCLCTNNDSLGEAVQLGSLEPGDVIGVASSGAYGLSFSPVHFTTHPPPWEIFVEEIEGRTVFTDATREGTVVRPPVWPNH